MKKNQRSRKVCVQENIEHRLNSTRNPQISGIAEKFNWRIADVLKTTLFESSKTLEETIKNHVMLYNHEISQKLLGHKSQIQSMKKWYEKSPIVFRKSVDNLEVHDK